MAAPTPLSSTSTITGVAEVASRSRAEMPAGGETGESESIVRQTAAAAQARPPRLFAAFHLCKGTGP